MALREVLVKLGIEVDRQGVKKAKTAVDGIQKSMRGLSRIAQVAGALFIGGKIAQGFKSIIVEGSDASETLNKLGATFGDLTPQAIRFAEETAGKLNVSSQTVQDFTANVGSLVKPLTESTDAALEMSQSVAGLAFDIASFENVRPEDALTALRSGLIGSFEPLSRFGILTRKSDLETFRLKEGMKKSVKAMSEQELVALRLAKITHDMGNRLGDAARTAFEGANAMRGFGEAMKDLRKDIGLAILPLFTKLLKVLTPLARVIGKGLAKAAKSAIRIFRGLGHAFEAIRGQIGTTATVIGIMVLALGVLQVAFGKTALAAAVAWIIVNGPLLLTIALMGLIAAAIGILIDDFVAMGDGANSVTGTMITGISDLIDELGSVPAAMAEMLDTALAFWSRFFLQILGFSDDTIDNIFTTFRDVWTKLMEVLDNIFTLQFGALFDTIRKGLGFLTESGNAEGVIAATRGRTSPLQSGPRIRSRAGGAGGSTSNFSGGNNDISISVDGSQMTSDPQAIAGAVSEAVTSSLENQSRELSDAFGVSGGG